MHFINLPHRIFLKHPAGACAHRPKCPQKSAQIKTLHIPLSHHQTFTTSLSPPALDSSRRHTRRCSSSRANSSSSGRLSRISFFGIALARVASLSRKDREQRIYTVQQLCSLARDFAGFFKRTKPSLSLKCKALLLLLGFAFQMYRYIYVREHTHHVDGWKKRRKPEEEQLRTDARIRGVLPFTRARKRGEESEMTLSLRLPNVIICRARARARNTANCEENRGRKSLCALTRE